MLFLISCIKTNIQNLFQVFEYVDDGGEDFFDRAVAFDVDVKPFLLVMVGNGEGFVVVFFETALYGSFVVIGTPVGFCPFEDAAFEFLKGDIDGDEPFERRAFVLQHLVEDFGLCNGAWKAVEEETGCLPVLCHAVGD